jgi:hypothetical protein
MMGRPLTYGSAVKADSDHRAEYFAEAPIANRSTMYL